MKVLVFCSTSKPLISSYLGINAVYRNSFDSLPSELIVIAHDNDRLSGDRGNLWGGGGATIEFTNKLVVSLLY